jgi:hypothetical protein
MTSTILIEIILNDASYLNTCKKINFSYYEDIYHEVIEQLLTMPPERLPSIQHLPFWFYCVAKNIISRNGKLGKIVNRELCDITTIESFKYTEVEIKKVEEFMFSLSEFENRIVLLYNELGDMKKVQRATGISYSALRAVKEKIKKIND